MARCVFVVCSRKVTQIPEPHAERLFFCPRLRELRVELLQFDVPQRKSAKSNKKNKITTRQDTRRIKRRRCKVRREYTTCDAQKLSDGAARIDESTRQDRSAFPPASAHTNKQGRHAAACAGRTATHLQHCLKFLDLCLLLHHRLLSSLDGGGASTAVAFLIGGTRSRRVACIHARAHQRACRRTPTHPLTVTIKMRGERIGACTLRSRCFSRSTALGTG